MSNPKPARVMPTLWTQNTPVKATASTRIDMSDEIAGKGLCPACQKPMIKALAAGIPVQACAPCRIALPVSDNDQDISVQDMQLFM